MIKKFIKHDMIYYFNSKLILIFSIALCVCYSVILFMNYSSTVDTYNSYKHSKEYYEENNIEIEDENSFNMTTNTDGSVTIENPCAYYKYMVGQYIFAASPNYTLTQMMEFSLLIFPILFGVLGLIVSTLDRKNKTIKYKLVRLTKVQYMIEKHCSLILCGLIIMTMSLFYAKLLGYVVYNKVKSAIPIEEFVGNNIFKVDNILYKVLFAVIVAVCFMEIGYLLGAIFKNSLIGVIILAIYSFLCGNWAKYDLLNCMHKIADHIFECYGVLNINSYKEISIYYALGIITLITVFSFGLSMAITKKQSGFIS